MIDIGELVEFLFLQNRSDVLGGLRWILSREEPVYVRQI